MISRRDMFHGLLASPLLLSRADAQLTPAAVKFRPEMEPLVSLIENTPREKCAEMAVEQLRRGVSYRQMLAALSEAMEAWDFGRAERAVVALARSRSANEIFAMLWRYGARDYRNIGHKAIYMANACRTLQAIGWQHAEPVLRSLVSSLLDFGREQQMNGYALDDQCYPANLKHVKDSFSRLGEIWSPSPADA